MTLDAGLGFSAYKANIELNCLTDKINVLFPLDICGRTKCKKPHPQ